MTEIEALEWIECIVYEQAPKTQRAMLLGIKALEKQIAKKPIVTVDEHTNLCWIRCSCCDSTIYWRYPKPFQYCVECGQKILDWGNEDAV
jgi:hypothetical protein